MDKKYIIDEMEEVIYVSDPKTYELYYVNKSSVSGIFLKDFIGKKCYEALQGKDRPCEFCNNALLTKDKFYLWEHTNERLKRHYILKDKLIDWYGKTARLEIAIDITERENVSKKVKRKLEIEEMLVECIRSLTGEKNLDVAVNMVLSEIGSFYKADRAYIFEINQERKKMYNTFEWCLNGIEPQIDVLQEIDIDKMQAWKKAFEKNDELILEDIKEIKEIGPLEYESLKSQKVHSLLAVNIKMEGKLVGYIGVDNPQKNIEDTSLLKSLSYFIVNELSKRRLHEKLKYISYHDSLTGLNNRYKYVEYLRNLESEGLSSIGVIYLDINGLKQINDRYGHNYGDAALITVAETLAEFYDKEGIFRLSGDEFIVFCKNFSRHNFIEKVRELKKVFSNESEDGVSIGYTWDDSEIDMQHLINQAEEMLYVEKQRFYQKNPGNKRHHNALLFNQLLKSIENKEFEMYLQPKTDCKTGKIIGAEALVRHRHPELGIVPPNKFIPLLEKEHSIRYIDFFIFEEVCKVLEKWQREGLDPIVISLNFSRITLMEDGLIESMNEICNRYHCSRELIEIEITETVGEMERQNIIAIAISLREAGFGLSLDDFGTKYTNMDMLTVLDVDVLKLDKSLINDIVKNKKCQVIVKNIIHICKDMGIVSIAEGVETKEQLSMLQEMDCDQVQGYYFSKPLPLVNFEGNYRKKE